MDPCVFHIYRPKKRDWNPNEINSLKFVEHNSERAKFTLAKIRDRANKLREPGDFWNSGSVLAEIGDHVPELKKYIEWIMRVVGHTTITINVLGIEEADVIKRVFQI